MQTLGETDSASLQQLTTPSDVLTVADERAVDGWYARQGKRALDLVLSSVLIVVLSPLLALVALAVRLQMGRPILFHQERIGLDGSVFGLWKFRSMGPDRRQAGTDYEGVDRRVVHKSDDDPRHTPVGRMIRRWSLDELPQLINVVKGEMSLVGPRPELVDVAERHGLVDHPRTLVRPGMTGLWQISNHRAGLLCENVELDVEYVETVSLTTDVRIILGTIPALLRSTGR